MKDTGFLALRPWKALFPVPQQGLSVYNQGFCKVLHCGTWEPRAGISQPMHLPTGFENALRE